MFDKLFLDHPRTVDETYFEHLRVAAYFGGLMLLAGLACLVHALIPGAFTRTGSAVIRHLHERMATNRHRGRSAAEAAAHS
jgi:hypothetical protein